MDRPTSHDEDALRESVAGGPGQAFPSSTASTSPRLAHLSPDLLIRNLVVFARVLRASGIAVDPGQIADFLRGLTLIEATDPIQLYYAARAVFVRRVEDIALFDRAFHLFWRELGRLTLIPNPTVAADLPPTAVRPIEVEPSEEVTEADLHVAGSATSNALGSVERADDAEGDAAGHESMVPIRTYSAAEALRQKSFERLSPHELEEARRFLGRLRWHVGTRRTRRTRVAAHGPADRLDLSATIRRSLRAAGEIGQPVWRQRKRRPRPLVIIGDISGSMEQYTRLLLRFFYAARRGRSDVEVFVFGTRLTRITRDLEHRDVDEAMQRVAAHVVDWAGGTRIGASLADFNRTWARRVLGRGAVTILVSDGCDRGDAELLRQEMERLQRASFRLIWLNPLLGLEGYEPLTIGMRTALPYVDDFLPAHNLASLHDLVARLSTLEAQRPMRRSRVQSST